MKRCDHDELRNIQIPYLEVDKYMYHCTQNPVMKKLLLRVIMHNVFIRKGHEASNLLLCYLTGYLENRVYFHIVFSLLVVDCQLEILEFLLIFIDVIDRPTNARSHRKI